MSANSSIILYFSEDVLESSFTANSVSVADVTNGGIVPITINFPAAWPDYDAGRIVELVGTLSADTEFRVDLGPTVASIDGRRLGHAETMQFRTANAAPLLSPSPQACAQWGGAVACADFDNDNYDDVAVAQNGVLGVFFGPDLSRQISISGEFAVGGTQLLASGDVDGDRLADLAANAYDGTTGENYVTVLLGPDLSRAIDVRDPVGPNPGLGGHVVLGDVDGDKLDDLFTVSAGAGGLIVLYGPDFNQYQLIDRPTDAGPTTGFSAALGVADLDGDGTGELLVGDPLGGYVPVHGRIFAFWGPLYSTYTILTDSRAGVQDIGAAFSVRDVNGDLIPDVVSPAWSSSNRRERVLIWQGPGFRNVRRVDGFGDTGSGLAHIDVADIDGDLRNEIILGTPTTFSVQIAHGPSFAPRTVLEDPLLPDPFHAVGWSLATGDVNRDGFAEVVVGVPHRGSPPACDFGRAYVFFGP